MWYVEYFDSEGFWYLDGGFVNESDARAYSKAEVEDAGFDLVKIYRA